MIWTMKMTGGTAMDTNVKSPEPRLPSSTEIQQLMNWLKISYDAAVTYWWRRVEGYDHDRALTFINNQ